jgi:hypothetical protein
MFGCIVLLLQSKECHSSCLWSTITFQTNTAGLAVEQDMHLLVDNLLDLASPMYRDRLQPLYQILHTKPNALT